MNITLKLFSGLAEYLPADADGNAVRVAVDTVTANGLIDRHRLPRAEAKVVMLNGEFLAETERDRPLNDGDVVAIWPSIQGG